MTDPRNGKRVALKKMPNVFQSFTSSKRAYRELKMLCFFKQDNVSKKGFISSLVYVLCNAGVSLNADNYSNMHGLRSAKACVVYTRKLCGQAVID